MKVIYNLSALLASLLILSLLSCKKSQLMTYTAGRHLYFDVKKDGKNTYSAAKDADSMDLSFALMNDATTSTELKILVRLAGPQPETDLPYAIAVVPSGSSATEGVDFEIGKHVFPARSSVDTLRIKINRTKKMQSEILSFELQLKDNENFGTMIQKTDVKTQSTRLKCQVYDILFPPPGYLSAGAVKGADFYYGKFSKKKFFTLINKAIPPFTFLGGRPSDQELYSTEIVKYKERWSFDLYQYLRMQKSMGNTIYEDDGTEMTMGPFY